MILHENLFPPFAHQAGNINRSLCLSVDKTATVGFSIMQKNWIYLAETRPRGRSESRAEIVRTPLTFCFTHSRVESKGGRTERGRGGGRTRTQDEERFTGEHPTSTLVATHRGIHIRGRRLRHHTSPPRARFSARCCFAFYTGVEIWSLDSPMHHRSGPPLTGRTASSSSFNYEPRSSLSS